KIDHVSKQYRLGLIGGTTFRDELHRWNARIRHQEDPTRKVGIQYPEEDVFMALDDVSFAVEKGERVGIIGRNGAGKSTLLKLISRITSPTGGDIWLNGRVASLLEVGTGFNGELTGRENIYMNGAILGMTKKEIDSKIEDIIEFSECRQFIDTPVKRYSSGMNVKLGFAVAAHLDSEIMIMDEVLAVGGVTFQKKCLRKMDDVSRQEGRTILYVSHNMNTVRQLCDRCIVLDHGRLLYEGNPDEAIGVYMGLRMNTGNDVDLRQIERTSDNMTGTVTMTRLQCLDSDSNVYDVGAKLPVKLTCTASEDTEDVYLRIIIKDTGGRPVTMMTTDKGIFLPAGQQTVLSFTMDVSYLAPGNYTVNPVIYRMPEAGNDIKLDVADDVYWFDIRPVPGFNNGMNWRRRSWGYFFNPPLVLDDISASGNSTSS
ncbi:MAG: ABC transporter ATP-binding protein, partial [Solobacterium sp.]|nr:ABC transporter ATP-binding protein [Solobacterium sp.]